MSKKERLLTNFSAGPAALPTTVVRRFTDEFDNYRGRGISVAECSHRSKLYKELHTETIEKICRVLAVPDDYEVLLLAGGATLQFALIAYNFAATGADSTRAATPDSGTNAIANGTQATADSQANALTDGAAYCVSGAWAQKALESAQHAPTPLPPTIAYDGADHHYTRLPQWSDLNYSPAAPYLHITSNETINGLQFKQWPANATTPPLIADMSSDIMSKPIPVSRFAMIYAGAQKNIGIAGVTVVIIRRSFLERALDSLPAYLNYRTHAQAGSLHNTPPTVSVFSVNLMMDWIIEQGGIIALNARNLEKANLLYSYIDEHSDFYHNPIPTTADRSVINAIFTLPTDELTKRFLAVANEQQIIGIEGHRSVGGCRISLYNAIELRAVERLIDVMSDFHSKHKR